MAGLVGLATYAYCHGFTAEQCRILLRPANLVAYHSRVPDAGLVQRTADDDADTDDNADPQPGDCGVDPDPAAAALPERPGAGDTGGGLHLAGRDTADEYALSVLRDTYPRRRLRSGRRVESADEYSGYEWR
jgi:hypothetical protein